MIIFHHVSRLYKKPKNIFKSVETKKNNGPVLFRITFYYSALSEESADGNWLLFFSILTLSLY